jgi:CRP/FNR family transcriptional regulator
MENANGEGAGPAVRAIEVWRPVSEGGEKSRQLLSREERANLAVMASIVRFEKGAEIYRQGEDAKAVFNIVDGVVKAYKVKPDGGKHIAAFLFADDVFGLAETGHYTNSTQAITPVTAYRLPVKALRGRLGKDAGLQFKVICKLCHELRQAQRHAFLLTQRRAVTKVALFLQMMGNLDGESDSAEIYLPMSRSDIGDYVGMSLAAVSRAFHALSARGVIEIDGHHAVKITNPAAFNKLAGDPDGGALAH